MSIQHEKIPNQGYSAHAFSQMDASIGVVNIYFVALAVLAIIITCGFMTMITADSTIIVEQCSLKYPRSGETCWFGEIRAIANPHYATPGAPSDYTPPIPLPTPSRTPTTKMP